MVAAFDGGTMTSDAGALLLGATSRDLGLTCRLAACFKDSRDPAYIEHTVETLLIQRVVGIALSYADLNDLDQLRHDPVRQSNPCSVNSREAFPSVQSLKRPW